jgi:uncharacterized sulfatase
MPANIATYYGMITMLDEHIGRILDHLDHRGLRDETLVVFTTDHGHFLGEHGLVTKGPFHFEEMIRLPMLVRQPGRVPPGSTSDAMVSLIDLAPTFLGTAGIPTPGAMQGLDLGPVLEGTGDIGRDHVLVENRHEPSTVHLRTYVSDRYKLTTYRGRPWGELFDLDADPGEVRNLYDDPDCRDLRRALYEALAQAELAREPTPVRRVASA